MSMEKTRGFIQGGRGQLNITTCQNLTPYIHSFPPPPLGRKPEEWTHPQRHSNKTHIHLMTKITIFTFSLLEEIYEDLGDTLAVQYGGSQLVHRYMLYVSSTYYMGVDIGCGHWVWSLGVDSGCGH